MKNNKAALASLNGKIYYKPPVARKYSNRKGTFETEKES
jgi:hypothetical protein